MNKQRIFVVDDTKTFRAIIKDAINDLSDIAELIGEAGDGIEMLEHPRLSEADLILMDIYMPRMNGLEALRAIRFKYPRIAVVMVSDSADQNTPITIAALTQGAIDFIHKDPDPKETRMNRGYLKNRIYEVLQILRGIKPSKIIDQNIATIETTIIRRPHGAKIHRNFSLIAIGVSTGGPKALSFLLPKLSNDIGCPVLVVQHMPEKFTKSLAESLNNQCSLLVKEAEDKEFLQPNVIYIAQGGKHMELGKNDDCKHFIQITDTPPVLSCKPSVNVLFNSIASNWKKNSVLSIILTGMGNDGTDGVRSIKAAGGYCLAQDKESSIVYGMPKSIVDNNLADEILPLTSIPNRISRLVKNLVSMPC